MVKLSGKDDLELGLALDFSLRLNVEHVFSGFALVELERPDRVETHSSDSSNGSNECKQNEKTQYCSHLISYRL